MCFLPQRYNFSPYPPNNLALSHKKLLQSEGGDDPQGYILRIPIKENKKNARLKCRFLSSSRSITKRGTPNSQTWHAKFLLVTSHIASLCV